MRTTELLEGLSRIFQIITVAGVVILWIVVSHLKTFTLLEIHRLLMIVSIVLIIVKVGDLV